MSPGGAENEPTVAPVPLLVPGDGVPPVLTTADDIAEAARKLATGTGPLAVDAERASGFRYSQRAYLIQLRRAGAGTVLIDPIPTTVAGSTASLAPLAEAINEMEWVLHAADQDLPCLSELGLTPARLFDTELAGRLAGFERVGLAAIVERTLGLALRKGHGADDWSTRPLPEAWLVYAALDVEVLLELRDVMAAELTAQGKSGWAAQEFEYVRTAGPAAPKPERWRRTSGIHTLRSPRQLAIVRELWHARDTLAAARDVAPGRVLPDSAIIAAANAAPTTIDQLRGLPVFGGTRQRRLSDTWLAPIAAAAQLADTELPPMAQSYAGPPPANRWDRRNPEASKRLSTARAAMTKLSKAVDIPIENLLTPDLLRRMLWDGLDWENHDPAILAMEIDGYLTAGRARPWQRELTVEPLAEALS